MDSENIFDLFGRQISENNVENSWYIDKFADITIERLKNLHTQFSDHVSEKVTNLHTKFGDHVTQTQNLVNAIGVTRSYISLKNKRIVGVKPSIDKHDVVIKSELEEVLDSIIKVEKEYSDVRNNLKGFKKNDYKDLKKFIHNISLTESADKKQNLDVKSMRIKNVSKGIENYDAIVKLQLDDAISTLTTTINNNHTELMNTVNKKIEDINSKISVMQI